jgi:hemolysin D
MVSMLVLVLIVWAAFGKLDIVATAEGKLAPQTLLKIVQPAEAGVVKQLLVQEGDSVVAGQVLALLDATLVSAEKSGVDSDLAAHRMRVRRIEAELGDIPMVFRTGDEPQLFAQVQREYSANRLAFADTLGQEKSNLVKVAHELQSASETLAKLEQTLPSYEVAAKSFSDLAKEGYVSTLLSGDKQREAIEKSKDAAAQKSTVAALRAAASAQRQKINQVVSGQKSALERELADTRARIAQLQPNRDKAIYKQGQLELRAPQDGVINVLATTTVGTVVQAGTVILTLVPKGERLFVDVNIKNADVGFVAVGQRARIKLAAYPFQRYGMLDGKVVHISADASEISSTGAGAGAESGRAGGGSDVFAVQTTYKARIELDKQTLKDTRLRLVPGMQISAEVHQVRRTVLEYLLSPVRKTVSEAAQER